LRDAADHEAKGRQTPDASYWVAVAVANGGHRGNRPPDRIAEIGDVGVGTRPLGIEHC
jgi:hypothetical protein